MTYRVDIIDEDGEHFEQEKFETIEEALALKKELIQKGFEYIGVFKEETKQ